MATYYVRSSGGSDGNSGLSFALGWATMQYAADNASAAGDIVLVCADGTHTPSATVDFDTNAGGFTNPIIFRGASATGVDDGTVATISGSSLPATSDLFYLNITNLTIKFEGFRLTAATRYNINLGTSLDNGQMLFRNCRIDNASADGVYDQETDNDTAKMWIDCEIDNNGDRGIDSAGTVRGGHTMHNCSVHDNASHGIEESVGDPKGGFYGCQIYDNGGDGIQVNNTLENITIRDCVFFNNTGDGLELRTDTRFLAMYNNIFRSNGGYGINTNSATNGIFAYADYNCFSNNTSGAIDINSGTPPGDNNVIDNPDFTSETDGSEDFTLQSSSPCIDAGSGYGDVWDIGAAQSSPGGGGGDTYSPLIIAPNGNRIGVKEV